MNNYKTKISPLFKAISATVLALATSQAGAAVQFRVGFEADTNTYAVYMKADKVYDRDMLLSSQVTLVVPHDERNKFTVDNIQSYVPGANWMEHARIDAPAENNYADYVSLGYSFIGTTPPDFGWAVGQEQKILSFSSETGCSERVKLIDNKDAFSQLPNSANTNPGNDFVNIGWLMSNSYTGNYGSSVTCGGGPVTEASQVAECKYSGNDTYYLGRIERLETLRDNAPVYLHARFDLAINNLKTQLSCQK